jgi:hypothetical protein
MHFNLKTTFKIFLVSVFLFVPLQSFASISDSLKFVPQVTIPGEDSEFKEGVQIPVGENIDTVNKDGKHVTKVYSTLLPKYIRAIYNYGIGIAAFLALAMIVAGGLIWLTSGGSTEKISTARSMIVSAIIGLVLLLGAYTILQIVSPALLNFKPIKIDLFDALQVSGGCCEYTTNNGALKAKNMNKKECDEYEAPTFKEGHVVGESGLVCVPSGECPYSLAEAGKCNDCNDCIQINVICKDGNLANRDLAESLSNAHQEVGGWIVTEAWPPTVAHSNPCHYNGTCVDVGLRSSDSAENVEKIYQAFIDEGLRPVFETINNCDNYPSITCYSKSDPGYNHITGNHFSVYK